MSLGVPRLVRFVGEKYAHGIIVGFGIMTAQGIFHGCRSVKITIAQFDWKKIDAEQVLFWRKS